MDKFEEFQTTMAKSNELFTTFRQEMEKVLVLLKVSMISATKNACSLDR